MDNSLVVELAKHFFVLEGRWPSRIDWRGDNLTFFREKHGADYPSERVVARKFGGWGGLLVALGLPPRSTKPTADVGIRHVVDKYGAEVMPGNNGTIDCFIDGEAVEVKAASLSVDGVVKTPRFRFRLHRRSYSSLVDRLVLVGVAGGKPVVEWNLDKVGMLLLCDGRDDLSVLAKHAFQGQYYPLYVFEAFRERLSYEELLELADF